MNIHSITGYGTGTQYNSTTTPKTEATKETTEEAAVYEKSSGSNATSYHPKIDHKAIVAQLKADAEARQNQLTSIVEQMISKQGQTIGIADSIWSFLAKGDYTVSPSVKAQAQADISEDGYWGVKQTSDRIVDFAKALSGGDSSKAEELLAAFKKGFEQATHAWGKSLPSISQETYKAVEEKFQQWMNEENMV